MSDGGKKCNLREGVRESLMKGEPLSIVPRFAACALLALCAATGSEAHAAPACVTKSQSKPIYSHVMPWFEDPTTSGTGKWGIHWTMANQNPNVVDGTGRRQIASYYYPLIGPYGSSDQDVIEYQLLLMMYSGIDGVLIDWPGTINYNDYPKNRKNAEAMIAQTAKFGMQFGVIYEDHNVALAQQGGAISDTIGAAQGDVKYAAGVYFNKSNYISVNGAPLFMVFGPQTFQMPSDWSSIFSVISSPPTFLTLWYQDQQAGASAQGEFPWVYKDFMTGLQNFYNMRPMAVKFGVAYPGFNTFYAAGNWGAGPGWTLPYNGSSTFSQTLQLALSSGDGFVQIATWNDYGEGTMVEPTVEFGYGFLTTLQQALGVTYSQNELQLVNTLFQQRKQFAGNAGVQSQLDQASGDLANCDVTDATNILNSTGNGGSSSSSGSGSTSSSGGSSGSSTSSSGTSSGSSGSSGGTGTSGSSSGSSGGTSGGSSGSSGGNTSSGGGSGSGTTSSGDSGSAPDGGDGATGSGWPADSCGCVAVGARRGPGWLGLGVAFGVIVARRARRRANVGEPAPRVGRRSAR
jgi:hypothetical protein